MPETEKIRIDPDLRRLLFEASQMAFDDEEPDDVGDDCRDQQNGNGSGGISDPRP